MHDISGKAFEEKQGTSKHHTMKAYWGSGGTAPHIL
jgi:hypothetical protein